MTHLLCRNRVRDYDRWKAVFDANRADCDAAGLRLVRLWRELTEQENVFFLFEVEDMERARAFLAAPEAARAGEESGVVDGEFHFVAEIPTS